MHGSIYSVLIAFANNMDNISVRIAYSIRGIKITVEKNLWISIITFLFSAAACYFGETLSGYMNKKDAAIVSMVLLSVIGLWIIIEPCLKKKKSQKKAKVESSNIIINILEKPESADLNQSKDIDFKEATFLGIALSINNIGGSFSAGMIGLNSLLIGVLSAIISFAALWAGNYLTNILIKLGITEKANFVSAILLILIGVKQLF
jgi:putative sporulation protein YtaF